MMRRLTKDEAMALNPVSEGTLLTKDLITALSFALTLVPGDLDGDVSARVAEERVYFDDECLAYAWRGLGLADGEAMPTAQQGALRDAAEVYLAALGDLLSELAPEGMYYGAHPGDGACFGFWDDEEDER